MIILGWSIGGFSASIAAYHYPRVHGLVIDASFDSIDGLGSLFFPESWSHFVKYAVNSLLPVHTVPYLAAPNRLPKNFVVIVRTQDQVMSPPERDGRIQLQKSRTVEMALKVPFSQF